MLSTWYIYHMLYLSVYIHVPLSYTLGLLTNFLHSPDNLLMVHACQFDICHASYLWCLYKLFALSTHLLCYKLINFSLYYCQFDICHASDFLVTVQCCSLLFSFWYMPCALAPYCLVSYKILAPPKKRLRSWTYSDLCTYLIEILHLHVHMLVLGRCYSGGHEL